MRPRSHPLGAARLVLAVLLACAAVACTTAVPGRPVSQGTVLSRDDPAGVDPGFVANTDGGDIDRLAATVITDVRAFWEQRFPEVFDKPFEDLEGGYFSVDTSDPDSEAPPCAEDPIDVEGNAFYCPASDVIAWDRAALLPVLRERFGEASVMLVLAHEMGHAVQNRTGAGIGERRADPRRFPTILVEAMADCYAGAFVRWVVDGRAEHLEITKDRLDSALESLISFRDPVGTEADDRGAHGAAFDRVSAFQDGYEGGVEPCAGMTVENRTFTLSGFIDAGDQARGGNLEFDQIIGSITPGLGGYFGDLVAKAGGQWRAPQVREVPRRPGCAADQGPVAFCPDGGAVEVDTERELPDIHEDIGDYATGTLLASRYALAALAAVGKPVAGQEAQRSAVCLVGAFTGSLFAAKPRYLSPGDMDEAVQVLLDHDYAARDVEGGAIDSGFDRVSVFRVGFTKGAPGCGLG